MVICVTNESIKYHAAIYFGCYLAWAALHPAESNAVYFVAKGDGSGTHNFSDNLTAHNQAVQAYLQARKGNK